MSDLHYTTRRTTTYVWTFVTFLILMVSGHVIAQSAPPPAVRFYVGDSMIDPAAGITLAQLPKLAVRIAPDSAFAAAHPHDVKYTFRWTLYVRSGSSLSQAQTGSVEALYPGVINAAKPGDVIDLEMTHLTRTDASGRHEEVKLDAPMKYVAIPVK